ncbi:hypothetical protein [Streptomyces cadmiisoli]|uniref:hypothetical protein n=1 Tax=Streptomyces cadmiisoli TaxID=2184053 RepID=UPI00364CA4A1
MRDEGRRQAAEAERDRARQEREEHRRRLETAKWWCPTCGHVVYPEDGIVSGSECRPCRNDAPGPRRKLPSSRHSGQLVAASSAAALAPDHPCLRPAMRESLLAAPPAGCRYRASRVAAGAVGVQRGGMFEGLIVVHGLSSTGGRRVTVHRHGRDEILGTAYSDHDLIVFLEAAGVTDPESILDDPEWVEWRCGRPHEWVTA